VKTKEIYLQRAIVEALNYSGCLVWRMNAGTVFVGNPKRMIKVGPAGLSDIIGIHKKTGRFVAIEVKNPGKEKNVTDLQRQFLENIREAGGITGVATSVDEAQEMITKYQELT